MENNEKIYTPNEVALAIADKIKTMYKSSKLCKSNTAHEMEVGKEANNEDAECPESCGPTERSKGPGEVHKRDKKDGKSAEKEQKNGEEKEDEGNKEPENKLPDEDEDEEYKKEYKDYDDGKEDEFEEPKDEDDENENENEKDEDKDKKKDKKVEKSLKLKDFLAKKENAYKSDPSLKPPKEWWDTHVRAVSAKKPKYSQKRIARILGGKWYHEMSGKARGKARRAEGKEYAPADTKKAELKPEDKKMEKFLGIKAPAMKPVGQGQKMPQPKLPAVATKVASPVKAPVAPKIGAPKSPVASKAKVPSIKKEEK